MKICKVIGNVQASDKHPCYEGKSVMIVQPIHPIKRNDIEKSFLSVDFVQSGPGDTVLVSTEGNCARQLFQDDSVPVHSVISAIVDTVEFKA
ncbi:MAG: EutN/CcmL family microcompartment protein [Nitrospinae bacterium]|nr:EutN/CcmL family microcompartment protein [Nitrospinota bacterium]